MTSRGLKIALGVSVALNLFAVGALAAGGVVGARLQREADRPPRHVPVMEVVRSLPETERTRVTEALRANALAARPDFQAARAARREAVEMAGAARFDRAAIRSRLAASNAAEMRGRARLEAGALDLLEQASAEDRARLAPILNKTGPRGRGGRDRGQRQGEAAAAASPAY